MTKETAATVERLDFSKPPPGYTASGQWWSHPRDEPSRVVFLGGQRDTSNVAKVSATDALADAWTHHKMRVDPPGLSTWRVRDCDTESLVEPPLWGWTIDGYDDDYEENNARAAAWAWYERRLALAERVETDGRYRIDHCSGCGGEHEPQADDVCPTCKPGPGLITTWGEAQAERYRSGERYSTPEGERDQVTGGAWPRCLTWPDDQVAEVERWLADGSSEMPEVLRG